MPSTSFLNIGFDLLAVGAVIAAIGILGFIVYFNNRKSVTHIAFLLFALLTILYGVANYLSYRSYDPAATLLLLRLTVFFATWHAFSFFFLSYVFPEHKLYLRGVRLWGTIGAAALVSILTLTPLVFSGITIPGAPDGEITPVAEHAPGIALFGLFALSMVAGGLYHITRKTVHENSIIRRRFYLVLTGAVLTFIFLITFNLLLPLLFNITYFLPLAPIFFFPFIGFTAYAIFGHNLLDVKIIASEVLTFVLSIVTLARIPFSTGAVELAVNILIFAFVLVFGILLIKSVIREVKLREELAMANERLRELDQRKSEFVSLASHQLRSPLTVMKGYASMLLEGSFGKLSKESHEVVDKIFQSSVRLLSIIEDFLTISRIEQNRLDYNFQSTDLRLIVKNIVEETKPIAHSKGLSLTFKSDKFPNYRITADVGKITQVISNLVDNAIKYSEKGEIIVTVSRDDTHKKIIFSIKDHGMGMSKETIEKLFQKFSRADGAYKVSTTGTGLGLYVASRIVGAHHGRIWAESEGEGKGSTFFVEMLAEA